MKLRAILIAVLLLLASAAPALADGRPVAPGWKLYTYAPSGNALMSHQADAADGLAAFTFPATPDAALLATERPYGPHAPIFGKTITATIRVDAQPGTVFTYYGEATDQCGTPASVRLYFNTNGKFGFGNNTNWYGHYWWSNPVSYVLANGDMTFTVPVSVGNWSDWGGELSTAVPDEFEAAASNPDLIGFSFGGGCFFENGVGTPTGSATFTVVSFDIN